MNPDHVIDVSEAVDYLQQFAWVKDFDSVIEQILNPQEQENANV